MRDNVSPGDYETASVVAEYVSRAKWSQQIVAPYKVKAIQKREVEIEAWMSDHLESARYVRRTYEPTKRFMPNRKLSAVVVGVAWVIVYSPAILFVAIRACHF